MGIKTIRKNIFMCGCFRCLAVVGARTPFIRALEQLVRGSVDEAKPWVVLFLACQRYV